ncbi:MAG: UvrD-helicase domain-containing protein [Xanthomonadales bacterium]|nr:UvrD-helicase domain-containing protein [Xanthomonadales bacterium]
MMKPDSGPGVEHAPGTFDPLSFPLSGKRLIEASAGTGKTYNIANLFLRLVLGHGTDNAFSVDQILVVTFTRAATSELNGRIRARLEEALSVFRGENTEDAFLNDLVSKLSSKSAISIKRLNDAILSMDEASISTIHSFAVQAAKTFLFETGALADIEISDSGYDARKQVVSDLYRELTIRFSESAPGFFALVPGMGFKDFHNYFGREIPLDCLVRPDYSETQGFLGLQEQFNDQHVPFLKAHCDFQQEWEGLFPRESGLENKDYFNRITDIFNEQLFDEFKKEFKQTRGVSSLTGYLYGQLFSKDIDYWDRTGTKFFDSWMRLSENVGEGGCFSLFLRVQKHVKAYLGFKDDISVKGKNLVLQSLHQKQGEFALDKMSLDDVVRLINDKLKDKKSAPMLRQIITQTYPVCLVDEFQDTDPAQFNMFNDIYSESQNDTGFFMIGDPKQSIYAFRGADIFSYLNVRRNVQANQRENDPTIFSLDTNWRSKAALVEATNNLFRESPAVNRGADDASSTVQAPVFIFEGIEYHPVGSCENLQAAGDGESIDKGQLTVGADNGLSDKPLVFIGNPSTEKKDLSKGALLRTYATDTAARISALLDGENGGKITSRDGTKNPVKPGQVAVLVREKWEARVIREELAKPHIGIRCVYLSQKESVFSDAEISEDIYHILVAINENNIKRSLKTALATPLLRGFRFDFKELERIETEESELELLIEEFGAYKKQWLEHGVLTALSNLMEKRGLYSAISKRQDSDRILTDFRHLGDILQQRDMDCGTAEQLIDWYATQLDDDSALEEDSKRIRLESDENLVKIVTIHVSKGLEYPVVFLPFFYLPRDIKYDKQLPLYHDEQADLAAVVDFERQAADVVKRMEKESLAEDVRMLYVAITRAIYQCNIGISATVFGSDETVWNHLLEMNAKAADWPSLKNALQTRIERDELAAYSLVGDVNAIKFKAPEEDQLIIEEPMAVTVLPSSWQITSYSALAHDKKINFGDKADDESTSPEDTDRQVDSQELIEDDKKWAGNARYTLKGSAITGNCLHDIFETYALAPDGNFRAVVEKMLGVYGLDKPHRDRNTSNSTYQLNCENYLAGINRWLGQAMAQPLAHEASAEFPSLLELFKSRQVSPELLFDFAIGSGSQVPMIASINAVLANAGLAGLGSGLEKIHGLMTGAIDLVFTYQDKVYVLDYKSNTLGKSPRFYDQESMGECMQRSRYDLQYMIYSTAVHRYFSRYYTDQYSYEPAPDKTLSFGGVFYLFLRGMGLEESEYEHHGVWFTRPAFEHIDALDKVFIGDPVGGLT